MSKKEITLIVVCLLLVASWGSREVHHSVEISEMTIQNSSLEKIVASQTQEIKTLEKQSLESKEVTKTRTARLLDGKVVYDETFVSKSVKEAREQMRSEYQITLSELTKQNEELKTSLQKKEITITKSAPRWNLIADAPLDLSAQLITAWQAGGGMNFGPISISIKNAVSLSFAPRASLMIRF